MKLIQQSWMNLWLSGAELKLVNLTALFFTILHTVENRILHKEHEQRTLYDLMELL